MTTDIPVRECFGHGHLLPDACVPGWMTQSPRSRRVPAVLATAALLAAGAGLGYVVADHDSKGSERDASALRGGQIPAALVRGPAPRIRLHDARGTLIDTRALEGRPYAITFLYTHCRDVCPLVGRELSEALSLLGPRANGVTALGVSVDPVGDTPTAARRWTRREKLPANFHYLVGSHRQLRPAWHGYFVVPQHAADRDSTHTASVWLVDKHGHRRTKYSAGAPIDPHDLAHDLRLLLAEPQ